MGIVATLSNVFYCGPKLGRKKDGTDWYALQFKANESYKGAEISGDKLALPNLMLFPPDGMDVSGLSQNHKYHLQVELHCRNDRVQYNLLRILPADKV